MNIKTVIVTGASSGIGRATAIRLAKDFNQIVLVARDEHKLRDTAKSVEFAGAQALVIAADLRVAASAELVINKTLERFGRIDALCNIAGAVQQVHLFDMTDEQWNDGESMKLHGARRLSLKAWPFLTKTGGSILFISGNSAQYPKPAFAGVAVINAAICALAKAFAEQGILDGVQVNSLMPGPVMTERRIRFLEHWSDNYTGNGEDVAVKFLKEAGISRYGMPEEIAETIAFLLSPPAKWLTGTAIRVDGGEVKGI